MIAILSGRRDLLGVLAAVGVALLVGAVVMAVFDPAQLARVPQAYLALAAGAVGSPAALAETAAQAAPLICAGLGIAFAFRAGLFNVGAQGQAIVGATLAAWVGFAWRAPAGLHLALALLLGISGGAIWAGLAGWLKARCQAHEVITTIMANYIAAGLLGWLLMMPGFQRPGRGDAIAPVVAASAALPGWGRLHLGLGLALLAAAAIWFVLTRARLGLEAQAVGGNLAAARTAGIRVGRVQIGVMAISGALAGLAGALVALAPGVHGPPLALSDSLVGSVGWDAITVALLGRSNPAGIVVAGLFVGALRAGSLAMQARAGVPFDLASVLQAVVVLVLVARLVRR